MAGNTIGTLFRLTTFGESHGRAIGGVIDGCPSGLALNTEAVQAELDRRRPGQSHLTTPRKERDTVEWLSGIHEGITTGAPIGFMLRNEIPNLAITTTFNPPFDRMPITHIRPSTGTAITVAVGAHPLARLHVV